MVEVDEDKGLISLLDLFFEIFQNFKNCGVALVGVHVPEIVCEAMFID